MRRMDSFLGIRNMFSWLVGVMMFVSVILLRILMVVVVFVMVDMMVWMLWWIWLVNSVCMVIDIVFYLIRMRIVLILSIGSDVVVVWIV